MDRLYGMVVLALGIGILWDGRDLSIGTLRSPGSGLFPDLMAVLMIILALVLILWPQKKGKEGIQTVSAKSIARLSAVFLAMVLYSFFLESLGFLVVSFLLTFLLFVAFGSQSYWKAIMRAVLFSGFAYIIFEVLFKSNLPKGMFGF